MGNTTAYAALNSQFQDNQGKMSDFGVIASLSDISQMLSMLLILPKQEVLDDLVDGSIASDISSMLDEISVMGCAREACIASFEYSTDNMSDAIDLSALRQDYTALFSHPLAPSVPIYESVYLHAKNPNGLSGPSYFVNSIAIDVDRRCRLAGLGMADGFNLPADHMSVELGLLAHLHLRLAKSLVDGDVPACSGFEEQISSFIKDHLNKWATAFFDDVADNSQTGFYRGVGLLGSILVSKILSHTGSSAPISPWAASL